MCVNNVSTMCVEVESNQENQKIKNQIIRCIKSLSEKGRDYYKPVRVGSFYSYNCNGYESNYDRKKTPAIKEFPAELELYLKVTISNFKKSDTQKYSWP